MKRNITILFSVFVFSSLSVLILFWSNRYQNKFKNGFVRKVDSTYARFEREYDLGFNSYYFAGFTDGYVYLGNEKAPLHLLRINPTGKRTVALKPIGKYPIVNSKIVVDSPYVYTADLNTYSIYRGGLETFGMQELIHDSVLFSEVVYTGTNSLVVRNINTDFYQYVLTKENRNPDSRIEGSNLLEKQIDGLFCTDGMLHYSHVLNSIVYVYFYRNQFLRTDSNLQLIYRSRTLDTITHARIQVAEIKSEHALTLSSPPFIVNRRSWVSGHWLFVNSTLAGDNEIQENFQLVSAMDVYDLHDGRYQFSFYLPDYKGYKMRHFAVNKNHVYALYGPFLVVYRSLLETS